MKIAFCVFVLSCLINVSMVSSLLGLPSNKSCADYALVPMDGFDKKLFSGDWFAHQLYDFPDSEKYDCYVLIKTPRRDGSQGFIDALVKPDALPELRFDGVAKFDQPGKGHFLYVTKDRPNFNGGYTILKTDYANYCVVFSCKDVTDGSIVQLHILSRTPLVTAHTQSKIDDVLIAHKIDRTPIRTLNAISCPSQLIQGDGLLSGLLNLVTGLLGGLLA